MQEGTGLDIHPVVSPGRTQQQPYLPQAASAMVHFCG